MNCMNESTTYQQVIVIDDYNISKTTCVVKNYIPEGDLIADYTNAPKFGGAYNCKKKKSYKKRR